MEFRYTIAELAHLAAVVEHSLWAAGCLLYNSGDNDPGILRSEGCPELADEIECEMERGETL